MMSRKRSEQSQLTAEAQRLLSRRRNLTETSRPYHQIRSDQSLTGFDLFVPKVESGLYLVIYNMVIPKYQ
jgi:hypothetical protein